MLDTVIWLDKRLFWLILSSKVVHFVNFFIRNHSRKNKCKKPHQNRMNNKNFTSPAKSHFLNPLTPFIQKTVHFTKNAWRNIYCIFYEESFAENPVKIELKIKFFHIIRNWISPPPTTLTPFSSKTVKDRENPLTYYWKLSLRGIKCKKPHQNRMKNKNFTSPAKSHFFNPLTPFTQKTLIFTKKCLG